MGQSPHPVFCRKTTWLLRGKLGQVMWEGQGDCWDHPGQERQRKAAKRGKREGKGGELGSRTDRDMQPYWDGGRVGEGQAELGPGCLEHGTPFTSRKSWRKWPGPGERMTPAGLLAPTPPPQS